MNSDNEEIATMSANMMSDTEFNGNFGTIVASSESIEDTTKCDYGTEINMETAVNGIIEWHEYVVKTESNGRPAYKCNVCAFVSDWGNVVQHVQSIHHQLEVSESSLSTKGIGGKKGRCRYWACDECNFKTPEFGRMSKHHACHGGVARQYMCEHCSYSTSNRISFTKHASCHVRKDNASSPKVSEDSPSVLNTAGVSEEKKLPCEKIEMKHGAQEALENRQHHLRSNHSSVDESFKCSKCRRSYMTRTKLEKHMWMKHDGNSPISKLLTESGNMSAFCCPYCRYFSQRKGQLDNHVLRRHKVQSPTARTQCSNTVKTINKLPNRVKKALDFSSSASAKLFHCPHCSFRSKWENALKRHLLRVHKLKMKNDRSNVVNTKEQTWSTATQQVSTISMNSSDSAELSTSSSAIQSFNCKICCFLTNHQDQFKSHMRNMHGARKSALKNLRSHRVVEVEGVDGSEFMKINASDESKRSTTCNKRQGMSDSDDCGDNLMSIDHPSDVTLIGSKVYTCNICSKIFDTSSQLDKHATCCADLRRFMCKTCGVRCNLKYNLKSHLEKVHSLPMDSKFYVLLPPDEASKSLGTYKLSHPARYQTKGSFNKAPLPVITGSQSDASLIGSRKCSASGMLRRVKAKDKYVCKICSKQFAKASRLSRHMVTHSDLRLYKCSRCGYRTNFKCSVTKHALRHHGLSDEADFLIKMSPSEGQETLAAYKLSRKSPIKSSCTFVSASEDDKEQAINCVLNESGTGLCDEQNKESNYSSNEPAGFTCHLCSNSYDSAVKLSKHVIMHEDLRVFMCKRCGHRCNFPETLRKHALKVHGLHNSALFLIRLTPSEARETIDAYKSSMQPVTKKTGYSGMAEQSAVKRPMTARKTRPILSSSEQFSLCENVNNEKSDTDMNDPHQSGDALLCEPIKRTNEISDCSKDGLTGNASGLNTFDGAEDSHGSSAFHNDKTVNHTPFVCSECGFTSKWSGAAYQHKRSIHPKARILRQRLSELQQVTDSPTVSTTQPHIPEAHVNNESNHLGVNLRRYMCQECGYRSNWHKTVKRHIKDHHPLAKSVHLSIAEAQQPVNSCKANRKSSCTTFSSKSLKPRRSPHFKNLEISQDSGALSGTYDAMRLKRFSCSLCYFRSNYRFEVLKHFRGIHPKANTMLLVLPEDSARSSLVEYDRRYCFGKGDSCKPTTNLQQTIETSTAAIAFRKVNVSPSVAERSVVGSQAESGGQNQSRFSNRQPSESENGDVSNDTSFEASDKPYTVNNPVNGATEYACDLCPYRCVRIHHLDSHKRMHKMRPGCTIKCSYCPYYTSHSNFLKCHMALHENGAQRPSSYTKDVSAELDVEMSPRVTDKPLFFPCDHCPFITRYQHKLISHKQLHRPRVSAPYKCSQCSLSGGELRLIKRHSEVHEPNYVEKRISSFRGMPSTPNKSQFKSPVKSPIKLPIIDVHIEQETMETATIKQKLIANRFGGAISSKGPRRTSTSPVKQQANGDLSFNGSNVRGSCVESSSSVTNESENGSQIFNVIVASEERRNARNLQLWRCDKCPYSTHSIQRFKRHVYLHGRRLTYECMYCDYSVSTCWRLTEHRRLHLVENQNLLHSQSVSNLIFLPSRTQTANTIGDNVSLLGDRLNLFEDSAEFTAPAYSSFRCSRCPFVCERRTDFHAHLRCHFVRAAHSCLFCDFSTSMSHVSMAHMLLHFALPGSETSSLPPSSCELPPWKMLIEDIENLSRSSAKKDCAVNENGGSIDTEVAQDFTDVCVNKKAKAEPLRENGVQQSGDQSMLIAAAFPAKDDGADSEKLVHVNMCGDSRSEAASIGSSSFVCQYCDRPFDIFDHLVKHEAQHVGRS